MNKDIPLSYVLIPILAFWLVIGASIQDWPQNGQEANRVPNFAYSERSLSIVQGNSLKGVSVPAEFKPETLGVMMGETLGKKSTIYLLAECESSLDPKAFNPDDPNGGSFGILQYQKSTFKMYCVDKYGLEDDIWNAEVQLECGQRMLDEGLLFHWGCGKKI